MTGTFIGNRAYYAVKKTFHSDTYSIACAFLAENPDSQFSLENPLHRNSCIGWKIENANLIKHVPLSIMHSHIKNQQQAFRLSAKFNLQVLERFLDEATIDQMKAYVEFNIEVIIIKILNSN
ncbi:hypothetical protein OQY15_09575 [Pedobacter sp. MC2016-15]|uniref:hypothetical protein n=1 Tax=Pedobacter sp. MC2016-15 TaxID=2994473 RepID=UPI0022460060|nr:hypothetical protein [Pedobacter sp. MC2016-15]MCX2479338.1 hypothetical protein [Pedobacter sp. MC2016-15]